MTDQRDPVKVSAAALLLAYCHITVLELHAAGVDLRRADYAGYILFDRVLVPATRGGLRTFPDPPGTIITDDMRFVPVKCLAVNAALVRHALAMDWQEARGCAAAAYDLHHAGGTPAAWCNPDTLARLDWLEETLRRVTEGGELLASARGAHDAHLGKPRRKRRPVQRDWLRAEIATALEGTWWALRYARLGEGTGRLWLEVAHIPAELRPGGVPTARPHFDPAIFEGR